MFLFKASLEEMRNIRSLAIAGMLTAIAVICTVWLKIPINDTLQIETRIIPIALAGILFGPVMGGLVGAASDIISTGSITNVFFGFTLNYFLIGVIFGIFLYRQKPDYIRLLLAVLTVAVVVNFALTSVWFKMMYGKSMTWEAILITRKIKVPVAFVFDCIVMGFAMKFIVPIYNRMTVR